jgi:HEAT repeat protein
MRHLESLANPSKTAISALLFFGCLSASSSSGQTGTEKAWSILQIGVAENVPESRAAAVSVLGLIENNSKAVELALKALKDGNPEVRTASADALGRMKAKNAASTLEAVIKDEKEVSVVLAGARSLIALGDTRGYAVYYAILTGEKKSGGGLLDDQKKMLKDPKKMAQFGFEQGVGFIPFAGVGLGAFKAMTKDDASPVRAAAAKILAKDPDPKSTEALIEASSDSHWIVRVAALDALAQRGDPATLPSIDPKLDDEKDVVKYTAAAAIVHLHDVMAKRGK